MTLYTRHLPEGSYTVTDIVVKTEEGKTFRWTDRVENDPADDGRRLIFETLETDE